MDQILEHVRGASHSLEIYPGESGWIKENRARPERSHQKPEEYYRTNSLVSSSQLDMYIGVSIKQSRISVDYCVRMHRSHAERNARHR